LGLGIGVGVRGRGRVRAAWQASKQKPVLRGGMRNVTITGAC
jgi:hypothetical protein